jgi:hypothetical protein
VIAGKSDTPSGQVAAKAIADAMPGSRLESVTAAAHPSPQKTPRCSTI